MALMNERDVYQAVAGRLRRQPNRHIWKHLEAQGWVEGAISPGMTDDDAQYSLDEVLQQYRELEAMTKAVAAGDEPEPPRRRIPPDAALRAATEIAAIEAASDPFVTAFRERMLRGQLLSVDAARAWLGEQFAGRRVWTRLHLPYWYPRNAVARSAPWESRTALDAYASGGSLQGGSEADTALDYLYCLCDVLVDTYRWDDYAEDVALFVLTGQSPKPLAGQFVCAPLDGTDDLYQGLIAIYVSARLSPKQLMAEYAAFRRHLVDEDSRVRSVSTRVARLAVFIATVNDGRSWREAMEAWGTEEPSDATRYTSTHLFSRDCRRAYLRVTGRELVWRNRRAVVSAAPAAEAGPGQEQTKALDADRARLEEKRRAARERRNKGMQGRR